MAKNSFVIREPLYSMLKNLDNESKGELISAIIAFTSDEEPEFNNPVIRAAFEAFLPQIKTDTEKYYKRCETNRNNRKGKTVSTEKTNENEKERIVTNENESLRTEGDIDNDIDIDNNLTVITDSISPTTQNNNLNINTTTSANSGSRHVCREVVESYNTICKSLPKVKTLSKAREKAIKARLNTFTKEDLIHAFSLAESSRFLCGANDKNWKANFDWIIGTKGGEQHLTRILEGVYIDRRSGPQRPRAGNFVNFEQRTDDLDALVAGRIMNGTKEVNTG